MDNIRPIVADLDEICDLLQAAIRLMQQPDIESVVVNHAQTLAQIEAMQTGAIRLVQAGDICRTAVYMAAVDQASDNDRWPVQIVSETVNFITMHEVLDNPSAAPYQQALARLTVTHDDCREMQKLKTPA